MPKSENARPGMVVNIYKQKNGGYWLTLNRASENLPEPIYRGLNRRGRLPVLLWKTNDHLCIQFGLRGRNTSRWKKIQSYVVLLETGAIRLYLPKRLAFPSVERHHKRLATWWQRQDRILLHVHLSEITDGKPAANGTGCRAVQPRPEGRR